MKTISHFTVLAVLALLAVCCSKQNNVKQEETYMEPELTHTLEKIDEYVIPLDSMTPADVVNYQYFKNNTNEYFTVFNKITQEINFYDINKRELAFKIPLYFEGPNSVGILPEFNSGYYIHTLDSIFVLNRNRGRFFLINRESQIVNQYNFLRDPDLPSALIAPYAPMLVHKGHALLLNIQSGMKHTTRNKNYRSDYAMRMSLKDNQSDYFLSYPNIFTKGIWGFNLHRLSWAFDTIGEKIFVSYALDDKIHSVDFNGNLLSEDFAKSKIVQKPESLTKKQGRTREGLLQYYHSQSKYGQVFYDPVRDILIRDCISGIPIDKQEAGEMNITRSLVLLNKDMVKIGEVNEPLNGFLRFFFNERGLHKNVTSENENLLKFEVYEYRKIN